MCVEFEGRVAVVTGAGGGLGRTYARELAARGAAVVVNDIGLTAAGDSRAEEVVNEIRAAGGIAMAHQGSIADPDQARALIGDTVDEYGKVDVLINNAGITAMIDFASHSLADLDDLLAVHLRGPFAATQEAFRHMERNGYGRIVITSSSAGVFGRDNGGGYTIGKAALIGLTNLVSIEGAKSGILANALLPSGSTKMEVRRDRDAVAGDSGSTASARLRDAFVRLQPYLAPEFVTPLALYLSSEKCDVSHRMYSVIGGRYARAFIGVSDGWLADSSTPPTVEELVEHLPEIESLERWTMPMSAEDEMAGVAERRQSSLV